MKYHRGMTMGLSSALIAALSVAAYPAAAGSGILVRTGLRVTVDQAAPDPAASDPAYLKAYKAAVDAYNKNDLDTAETNAKIVVQMNKKNAPMLGLLGYIDLTRGNYPNAIDNLTDAIACDPNQTDSYLNLGQAYLRSTPPDPIHAIPQFQHVLDKDHANVTALTGIGVAEAQTGDDENAVEHLEQAVKIGPTADEYFDLGVAMHKKGDLGSAADAFAQAAALRPEYGAASYNAGILYSQLGKPDKAEQFLEEFLLQTAGTSPSDLEERYSASMTLGDLYAKSDNYPEAVRNFTAASKAKPSEALPHFNLGVILSLQGQNDAAIGEYKVADELRKDDLSTLVNLGALQAAKGQNDSAIATLARAETLSPKTARIHSLLGKLYASTGDETKALAERKEAVSLNPKDSDSLIALANTYSSEKDYTDALAEYDLLLKIDSNNASIQTARGVAFESLNEPDKALDAFKAAVEIDGQDASALNDLDVVEQKLNDRTDALTYYKKALEVDPNLAEAKHNLDQLTAAQ